MTKRKSILLKEKTYKELTKCKAYERERLTATLDRLIYKYGELI